MTRTPPLRAACVAGPSAQKFGDGPKPVPGVGSPAGLHIPLDQGMAGEPSPRAPGYAFPNGIATNLVALPDFTRISTVCLPAL